MNSKLALIAERARDKKLKFTSLVHHINYETLEQCYREIGKNKACGIDNVTWEDYGKELQANIENLVTKMRSKTYRPQPVKRVYIPKAGKGGKRGLRLPCIEDKMVQIMIKKILENIYEANFLECSYGFRPGKSCHGALQELHQVVRKQPVEYVVEVDIRKFFDNVRHYWLLRCLEERIKDRSMIRLIHRFLKAGMIEANQYHATEKGTPQGGNLSPVLANIYLHYVIDLWFEKVFKPQRYGYMKLTRYADDFVVCFQKKKDAENFLEELRLRLCKFGLEIAEEKTKIIQFGRQAWWEWKCTRKKAKTFNFLGFTHYCGTSRQGNFVMKCKTSKENFCCKLMEVKDWIKRERSQRPLKELWDILKLKILGHYRYFGISGNYKSLDKYYFKVKTIVFKWINRRSQKKSMNWKEFDSYLLRHPLPKPKIYFSVYETVNATLKSPVREILTQGSVGGTKTMTFKLFEGEE